MGTCQWSRVISSTLSTDVNWSVNTIGLPLTVEPTSFQLAAGATQRITVTATSVALALTTGALVKSYLALRPALQLYRGGQIRAWPGPPCG